ncbi:MAG: response regulator, partial [Candidatus Cloacimonadaceae bacterium]|nr:response regulator [Candidatus Cloacimonadaceae bacterium]
MKEDYLLSLEQKKELILSLWETIQEHPDTENLNKMYYMMHNLSGTGATFGFDNITTQARLLENLFKQIIGCKAELHEELRNQIEVLVQRFIKELDSPVESVKRQSKLTLGEKKKEQLIYLVDDDPHFTETMSLHLSTIGYSVKIFGKAEDLLTQDIGNECPDVILMDMVFEGDNLAGAKVAKEFSDKTQGDIKIIFISVRRDLDSRLKAIRSGADYYLTKPVNMAHLTHVLYYILNPEKESPLKIVIVDDDEVILSYYKLVLEHAGMTVYDVSDPLRTLDLVQDIGPDLILLDMNMPGCSGFELSKIIRQEVDL